MREDGGFETRSIRDHVHLIISPNINQVIGRRRKSSGSKGTISSADIPMTESGD